MNTAGKAYIARNTQSIARNYMFQKHNMLKLMLKMVL